MKGLFTILSSVKSRIIAPKDKVKIENFTFRLFSQLTAGVFFVCSGLVTLNQLLGTTIRCIVGPLAASIRIKAINQYCFVTGTYTLPHLYNISPESANYFHFGVGPYSDANQKKYHRYYQWVPFVLFFQGCVFILPHFIWKLLENGHIKTYANLEISTDINLKCKKLAELDKKAQKKIGISAANIWLYLDDTLRYATCYIICEALNVVVAIAIFCNINQFLTGEFSGYGPEVWSFMTRGTTDQEDTSINPMNRVFPKVTKCDFNYYGPSGNIVKEDALCILSINIINEKIYAVLWFWLVILTVLGILNLIYRLFIWRFPPIRNYILSWRVPADRRDVAARVFKKLGYCDSLYLKRLSNNVNRQRMGEIIHFMNKFIEEDAKLRKNESTCSTNTV